MSQSSDKGAPATFLARALQKILAEKDVNKRGNSDLKKACEAALGGCTAFLAHTAVLTAVLRAMGMPGTPGPVRRLRRATGCALCRRGSSEQPLLCGLEPRYGKMCWQLE